MTTVLQPVSAPIRAGFIGPSLHCGGGERWMIELAQATPSNQVQWMGTVITQAWHDPVISRQLSGLMPVYQGGRTVFQGESRDCTLAAAVADLAFSCDVLVMWEVDAQICELSRLFPRVVHVALRAARIRPEFATAGQAFVAVGVSCMNAFSPALRPQVELIYPGINLRRCEPIRGRSEMRRTWNCGEDTLVVGYLGRISPEKNCPAVARAVQGLGPSALGVCYGARSFNADEIMASMRAEAGDRIQFHDAVDDVGSILHAIDVFMLPSFTEGCSLALLEAWAAGVPVVATAVGLVAELPSEAGHLVAVIAPDASSQGLANAVRAARGTSAVQRQMARTLVWERHSAEVMGRRWSQYLHRRLGVDGATKAEGIQSRE